MDFKEGHGRDLLIALAVVGTILLGLYLYTGNWPPPVVVESNSMMHVDAQEYQGRFGDTRAAGVPYGRIGTIDPGDLVLVKRMDAVEDIETFADGGDEHYGMPGEVIVYYRFGNRAETPIIHRALTYVERSTDGNGQPHYAVRWSSEWDEKGDCHDAENGGRICEFGPDGITISELRMNEKDFQHSGFITKGDNVVGNTAPDQVLGIMTQPVKIEWVQGVARGELPWFGLIKLMITDPPRKNSEVAEHPYFWSIGKMTAPRDEWIMLVVGIAVVSLAPLAVDVGVHQFRTWQASREDDPGHDLVRDGPSQAANEPLADEPDPDRDPGEAQPDPGERRIGIDLE